MHPVVGGIVNLYRQEGPCPDVQRQRFHPDTGGSQIGNQTRRKMQSGSRCSHCAGGIGEHGLIVGQILCIGGALAGNIGGERHHPCRRQGSFQRLVRCKMPEDGPIIIARFDTTRQSGTKVDAVTDFQALGVADKGPPSPRILPLVQRDADLRSPPRSEQLGRNHPRIVENQDIAALQKAGQVRNVVIPRQMSICHQQLRRLARHRRPERDPVRRQDEIEIVNAQRTGPPAT